MANSTSKNPTNGWDLVYAIRYSDVNAAIQKAWADPAAMLPRDFSWSGDVSGTQVSVRGKWQPWQLTIGGGGGNIVLMLPLAEIATIPAHPFGVAFPSTVIVKVTVLATFVSGGGTQQNLVTDAGSGRFKVDSITGPGGATLDFIAQTTLNEALQSWLSSNLSQFGFVFHTVDFAGKLAGDSQSVVPGLTWLLPTTVNYGVYEPPVVNGISTATLENSIFGVLAMTEQRQNPNPTNTVDPAAIPSGDRSGFLISAERFLEKFVQPSLASLFSNPPANPFALGKDGTLANTSALTFAQMSITDPDGSNPRTVTPDIRAGGFALGISGSELAMQMQDFHWVWSSGIDVYTAYQSWASLSLVGGSFSWAKDRTNPPTATIVKSEAVEIEEIVLPIAVAIAGAIVGVATGAFVAKVLASTTTQAAANGGVNIAMQNMGQVAGQVAGPAAGQAAQGAATNAGTLAGLLSRNWIRVLCGILGTGIGATAGAIPDILNYIAESEKNKIPQLQPFLANISLAMRWPNADQPLITSAQLSDALQIGVNPGFSA